MYIIYFNSILNIQTNDLNKLKNIITKQLETSPFYLKVYNGLISRLFSNKGNNAIQKYINYIFDDNTVLDIRLVWTFFKKE